MVRNVPTLPSGAPEVLRPADYYLIIRQFSQGKFRRSEEPPSTAVGEPPTAGSLRTAPIQADCRSPRPRSPPRAKSIRWSGPPQLEVFPRRMRAGSTIRWTEAPPDPD